MALYSGVRESKFAGQLASVAVALEALEMLLIQKGVLKTDELMQATTKLANAKIFGPELARSGPGDDYAEAND